MSSRFTIPPKYRLNHLGEGRYILTYGGDKEPLHHLCVDCRLLLQLGDSSIMGEKGKPILRCSTKGCPDVYIPDQVRPEDLFPS